jgi:dTMP kinase
MKNKGFFITFEGGEGAGKSTLIYRLDTELTRQGYSVFCTREPGGTALGEQIRQMILHSPLKISAQAELLLFLADRAQHIYEFIEPALNQGKVVLCDRFNDSTVAYQGYARSLGMEKVQALCQLVCGSLIPNVTFYLDVEPKEGMERATKQQRTLDKMEQEKIDFHARVREGFLQIAQSNRKRIILVDASKTEEVVFRTVLKAIEEKIIR